MNKIHGNVRIKLSNPISGNVIHDIEGENTFQSAVLAAGLRNLGSAKASFYNGIESREPWKDIVGGIFLFRDSLPSGAKYMSAGNQMTANGSFEVVNNANPPELGSYNSNESNQSASAITQVYDWTTSQGNGRVSSVALTSRVGGYIGYGNKSEIAHPTIKSFYEGLQIKRIQGINNVEWAETIQTGNMLYQITYNSTDKEVVVKKSRVPISQGSVFDWIPFDDEVIDVSSLHCDEVWGGGAQAFLDDGKIYLCPAQQDPGVWAIASKMYVWEYDPANDEISEIAITNTSGTAIGYVGTSVSYGRFYTYNHGENTHVFDLSDSTYIGYIETNQSGTARYAIGSNFPNGLTLIPINNNIGGAPMYDRFYDSVNRTCYPTNGYFSVSNIQGNLYYDPETDTLNCYDRYGAWAFNNPLYLATNYNLNSAVTKDATMTMKVIYTLEEA